MKRKRTQITNEPSLHIQSNSNIHLQIQESFFMSNQENFYPKWTVWFLKIFKPQMHITLQESIPNNIFFQNKFIVYSIIVNTLYILSRISLNLTNGKKKNEPHKLFSQFMAIQIGNFFLELREMRVKSMKVIKKNFFFFTLCFRFGSEPKGSGIVTLPKIWIQIGGVFDLSRRLLLRGMISDVECEYIKNVTSFFFKYQDIGNLLFTSIKSEKLIFSIFTIDLCFFFSKIFSS